jgi:flagellar biosynthesis/type III secretory pathway protein FliH
VEQAAYARGFTDGQREAIAAAESTLGAARRAAEGAARALEEARTTVGPELEETVTVLALAIAQRLMVRELRVDPKAFADLVRRTLATLPPAGPAEVRLHPEDLAAMQRLEATSDGEGIEWVGDPTMERGGYLIETPQRVLDGRLDTVFREFYERLRDA